MNKLTIFLILGALLSLVGFLGMCIYGAYTSTRGPTRLVNQYLGLWLNVFLFFNSLQTLYILKAPHPHYAKKWVVFLQYGYYAIEALLFLLICIGHGLYGRGDLSTWAVVNLVVCLFNIYLTELASNFDTEKKISCPLKSLSVTNAILKFLLLIICCLLTNGALKGGVGVGKYPPRGKIHEVKLEDGRIYNIHIYCEGTKNDSYPLIVFEGSAGHGYADYLGLQRALTERKLKSCSWDKAGLGFSDYMYKDQHNHTNYYHSLVQALEEADPMIFVGWGGGGAIIYDYAIRHPEMVNSLIYLDAYPPQIEWRSQAFVKNWTHEQYDAAVQADLNGRKALASIINGLGVPWGLTSIFIPPDNTEPADLRDERRWFMLTEKLWIAQRWGMDDMASEPYVFNVTIADRISVSQIMSAWNETQVQKLTCDKRKLDEEACQYEKKLNKYMVDSKKTIAPRGQGGSIVECTQDECDLGYFVMKDPSYTADRILEIFANTNKTLTF